LHCDLVYANRHARFQLPFVNLGLVPEAGSSLILPRLMGHRRAAELLLLGETIDATAAHQLGIVNAVVPAGDLMDRAWEAVRSLAAKPPQALRLSKALMRRGDADAVEEAIRAESQLFIERLRSPEAREAMAAFLERRPADFSRFS
jgi:enoyl-CoA hydratase/carnithine racemase